MDPQPAPLLIDSIKGVRRKRKAAQRQPSGSLGEHFGQLRVKTPNSQTSLDAPAWNALPTEEKIRLAHARVSSEEGEKDY